MKNKILLSISILMSGRKETKKCLDSLKKLINEIPCELIIVDTGCDDNTLSIIKEYTDIIIPFTWCSDFAKARNVGLERAIGEWFMFMDDDEWFEDTSEIINFFKNGEYKMYNSGCYTVRNFLDYDGKKYADGKVTRMTRIHEDIKFAGKVHEHLYPLLAPIKVFNSYVHHYGYIFETDKEFIKHTKRNIELLEQLILEDDNLRWVVQILPEYISTGEYRKAIDLAEKTIANLDKNNYSNGDTKYIGSIYGFLMKAYLFLYEYSKVINYTERLINSNIITEVAKAYMYKSRVIAFYGLEKYEDSIEAYSKYIDKYNKLHNNNEILFIQGGLLIEGTFSDMELQDATLHAFKSAIELNRLDIIEKYINNYNFEDKNLLNYVQRVEEKYHNLEEKINNNLDISNEDIKEYELLKKIFYNIIRVFSSIDNNDWYITYLKILYKNLCKVDDGLYELYNELFDKIADIFSLNKELWEIIDKYNIDINLLINNIDYDKWQDGINHWCSNAKEEELDYIKNLVKKWNKSNNIRYEYLNMKIIERKLVNKNDNLCDNGCYIDCNIEDVNDTNKNITLKKIEESLMEYANITLDYYRKLYREEIFIDKLEILPMQCRFAIDIKKITELSKEDGKKALERLKKIVDKYGYYTDTINLYSKLLGAELINKNKEANKAKQEMLELAIILKTKARECIENGNMEQAKVILYNVIQNVPTDKEAKEILSMIEE